VRIFFSVFEVEEPVKGLSMLAVAATLAAQHDPADPAAAVAPLAVESVFRDYRPYHEPAQVDWRKANEEVRRLGGHAGHVPGSASSPEPAKAERPLDSSHAEHHRR